MSIIESMQIGLFFLMLALGLELWVRAINRHYNRKMQKTVDDYMADKKAREEEEQCSE